MDLSLGWIALGKMNQLIAQRVGGPYMAARRHDDALHFAESAVEGIALGRRQRLAVLVENTM